MIISEIKNKRIFLFKNSRKNQIVPDKNYHLQLNPDKKRRVFPSLFRYAENFAFVFRFLILFKIKGFFNLVLGKVT